MIDLNDPYVDVRRHSPTVVSYGGGVNSLGVLVGLRDRGLRPDAIVFADTKGEKPETYFYLRIVLPSWLAANGFPPLTIVSRDAFGRTHTGDQSLYEECTRLGFLPSRAYGYSTCADKWKIDPYLWWIAAWPAAQAAWANSDVVTTIVGFDADEAHRVKTVADNGIQKSYPLIDWGWDRDDCVRAIEAARLPVPPKSACYYCPSSTKQEVISLHFQHPALFASALALEDNALARGKSHTVKGLGRKFPWRSLIELDAAGVAALPEAPVESCTVCMTGA